MEPRDSRAVQDRGASRALGDTPEKRENLEKSVWMESMGRREQVEWQDLQETEETQEGGVLKVLKARLEIKERLALEETQV